MATKKETTSKKTSSKKSTAPKKQAAQVNKKTKVSEEQIEKIVTNIEEPKVPNVEVVNGDPAVLAPKEEKVTEEKVEKKKEEIKKTKNNMTEKLNKFFNYFWNGQAIDY